LVRVGGCLHTYEGEKKKKGFFYCNWLWAVVGKKKNKHQRNEVKPLKEKTSVGCISHSFHVSVGYQSQNNFEELT
jgi:hypothetical protein